MGRLLLPLASRRSKCTCAHGQSDTHHGHDGDGGDKAKSAYVVDVAKGEKGANKYSPAPWVGRACYVLANIAGDRDKARAFGR